MRMLREYPDASGFGPVCNGAAAFADFTGTGRNDDLRFDACGHFDLPDDAVSLTPPFARNPSFGNPAGGRCAVQAGKSLQRKVHGSRTLPRAARPATPV